MASFITGDPFTIVIDDEMGRCLVSNKSFNVGDVLFEEEAIVFASDNPDISSFDNELLAQAFSDLSDVEGEFEEMVYDFAEMERVQCLDTARCFLQLIALFRLKESCNTNPVILKKLDMISSFMAENLESCESTIITFREKYPTIIPNSLTNVEAGKLLGILNTNQYELEDIQGSGLFVFASILEHNCAPNSSFTTHENRLYMAAIKAISPGDRVSIDYVNDYYHPTHERREHLLETYGFKCKCQMCCEVDRTRPVKCENSVCTDGTMLPLIIDFHSDQLHTEWKCQQCQRTATDSYVKCIIIAEETLLENPPTTLQEYYTSISQTIINRKHYAYFMSLDEMCLSKAADARQLNNPHYYEEALEIGKIVLELLEGILPPVHHEKVVYYDRIAQLAVASGNLEFAKYCFTTAYNMSCLACGVSTPTTMLLKVLAENTPKSISALQEHYRNSKKNNEDAIVF